MTSRRAHRERLTFEVARPPETTGAWLHVVSGPSDAIIARGALELAARFLAAGHRVLIVDGSPRSRLHDRFDREVRWGVVECLTGEMPVLGLVQDVGRLGLYLLAHGIPARRTHWSQFGHMLEEAGPHFGRLVLALDAGAPAAVGEALAGWHLEGWWCESGRRKGQATRFADRLGMHLSDLDLEGLPEPTLGSMDARRWALTTARLEAAEAVSSAIVAPEPRVLTPRAPAFVNDPVAPSPRPAIAASDPGTTSVAATVTSTLDSDARVRERLRFLLWMRRIQSEGRSYDPAAVPTGANLTSG